MITLKVNIDAEVHANTLKELLNHVKFVKSVENDNKSTLSTKKIKALNLEEENLILPAEDKGDPAEFYGFWKDRKIDNIKKFREELWRRKK